MSYFTIDEMTCKGNPKLGCPPVPYPQRFIDDGTWARIRDTANIIRGAWGAPLTVLSGYRDPEYNGRLRKASIDRLIAAGRTPEQAELETGVAKESQHMYGTAMDLQPTGEPQAAKQLLALAIRLHSQGKLPYLGGLGGYPSWIHCDCRPRNGNTIARWGL